MLLLATCLCLLPLVLISLYNLLGAPRLEDESGPPAWLPRVSLLIPVRNEARNLQERLLPALRSIEYPDLQICLLDDDSDDESWEILKAFRLKYPDRVEILSGETLPPTWVGKSWACHQLAAVATGEILLFCDADVRIGPRAILRTVLAMRRLRVACLSGLLRQEMETWVEKAIIPFVMQLPIAGLVPLRWMSRSRRCLVANGQWFAFERAVYFSSGGHAAVRTSRVEDMDLARLVRKDYRVGAILATEDLSVRMYRGSRDLREGFGKNLYPLIGGNEFALAAFLIFHVLTMVAPGASLFSFGLLVAYRLMTAALFRMRLRDILYHPLGAVLLPLLVVESFVRTLRGAVSWKGRVLSSDVT